MDAFTAVVVVDDSDPQDDWSLLLNLNNPVLQKEDLPRSRSRSRSIPGGLRPPPEDQSSSEVEGECDDIFLEQSPPQIPADLRNRCKGLPIFLHLREVCVSNEMRAAVECYTGGGSFYIGATVDPRRRWLGGWNDRGFMPGHCLTWDAMIVIAYTLEGPRIETALIELAKRVWQERCTNRKPDSRGQVRGVSNYIYACV